MEERSLGLSRKDMAVALWVIVIWSMNIIVLKIAVLHLPIFILSFLRVALLFPLLFLYPKPEKSLWKYFFCGFFLLSVYFLLLGFGLKSDLGAGLSSFFLQTQVLFGMLCCFLILGEKPTLSQMIGLFIAFIGVYLLKASSSPEQVPLEGILFLLASCASFGIGVALLKKYKLGGNMSDVTWLSMAASVPLLIATLGVEGPVETFTNIIHMSFSVILCLIFTTIFSTIWATYLWFRLLQKAPATAVTSFMLLLPLFSIILAYVFRGENVTLIQMIAGGFIILGVMFAQGFHQRSPLFISWIKRRRTS